jgi:hypothetical protein
MNIPSKLDVARSSLVSRCPGARLTFPASLGRRPNQVEESLDGRTPGTTSPPVEMRLVPDRAVDVLA